MLANKFTSLDEPTEVPNVAAAAVFPADGPKDIGSERQREPRDPMQKLKLPIVGSIS
jgi:hypothetical protein